MSRRLPPLSALRAFEAAARHLSFTRAASELGVTQAAISHQVKLLEDQLGQPLFRRLTRRLLLTDAGQLLWPGVRDGFDCLAEAVQKVQTRGDSGVLTLSLTFSFAARWLVPRLGGFLKAHPEIDVVYGDGNWIDDDGSVISAYPTLDFDARILQRDCFICQPSAFIRASAYRKCSLDPDWNFSFDYDLWIRMAKAGFRFQRIPGMFSGSRLHRGSLTIYERERVYTMGIKLLSRHYGYVPVSWVFGYTSYKRDGRDQVFEAMKPTLGAYLASLPEGFRYNPHSKLRYLTEWIQTPLRGALRRLTA